MVAEQQAVQRTYQRALRVIGRYLDGNPAYNVSISEVQDGFAVRSHSGPRRADEAVKHFEWERLGDLDLFYAGGRGLQRRPSRRRRAEVFPCGYEPALRKLGLILDEDSAGSVSIDQVQGGLDVSYMHPDDKGQLRKSQKIFAPTELCS